MKKHILSGVIVGTIFGAVIAWGAMSTALPYGGLVAIAAAFDGILGGIGGGWLIGITVAEGTYEGEELGTETERSQLLAFEAQG